MSEAALFIGWGSPYPGREHFARKTFTEFLEALTELETKGEIESFEVVMPMSPVGVLEGFVLVFGEAEKLMTIPQREIFEQLRIKARLGNAKVFITPAITGARVAETMAVWEQFATEIERELVPA